MQWTDLHSCRLTIIGLVSSRYWPTMASARGLASTSLKRGRVEWLVEKPSTMVFKAFFRHQQCFGPKVSWNLSWTSMKWARSCGVKEYSLKNSRVRSKVGEISLPPKGRPNPLRRQGFERCTFDVQRCRFFALISFTERKGGYFLYFKTVHKFFTYSFYLQKLTPSYSP